MINLLFVKFVNICWLKCKMAVLQPIMNKILLLLYAIVFVLVYDLGTQ